MINSQMDDMIKERLARKEQVDSLKQNLSKQIREKESLLQTITAFKNKSKSKENKYMKNEIDLEKKIKELDNIIYKVGQSAQTVHILHDIVEQARTSNHLDNALAYACMYTNEQRVDLHKTQTTNKPLVPSISVKSSTNASGSIPRSTKKNTSILQTSSSNQKYQRVEAHTRNVKYSLDKRNSMSKSVCSTCKKCIFDANHDLCVVNYLSDVNARARAKSVKSIKKKVWKPTGKMFKNVGYKWVPTGRTFTLVGNKCPLTRFTSTKIMPPRKPVKSTVMKNIKPISASQWRPRETKHVCSSSEPTIVEARTTNHLEPNKIRGSNASLFNDIMVSADNSSGLAPHRKEMCTLQCALSSKEEKSPYLRAVLSTTSIRLGLHQLTPGYISSGLVQNPVSPTPYVSPSKKDYEILFQQLFDEFFNPPPRAVSPDPIVVTAPRAVNPVGLPSSTTIDQDVPSASTSPTNQEIQSQVIHQDSSFEETTLQGVIPSNLHHLNQSFDTLTKLTKNHPLENVIGDPSRPVSTRSQLQEHAIWCYFDANDNLIPLCGKRSG
ncbi:hypothetical protein Tco_0653773 [Tanacetum coccineum]|uniref:Integrase, catalytic region, zinc finger, CCHC-type, peptidase aspartic, catalytic n=1 Tax=Tanacetum coccineum TaxID=301880 RepID=A0ABQ4X1H0_9ASTR